MSDPSAVRLSGWRIVAWQELRTLWHAGVGSWVLLILAIVLSITTVVIARTVSTNLLDAREAAVVLVRLATLVGAVLAMMYAADAISGERERATLESLLLTPITSRHLILGKAIVALSLWLGCYLVSIPYLFVIGTVTGSSVATVAVAGILGGLAAMLLVGAGLQMSLRTSSNRTSIAASLLTLAVLSFPGLLPARAVESGLGRIIVVSDPVSAILQFLQAVVVDQQPPASQLGWLVSPVSLAVILLAATLVASKKIALEP